MNKSGFTLVEIIMVIILLGVLGIIGTVGLNSAVSSDRGMYERQLQSAVRYAQNYAMSRFTYTAVVFSTPGTSPSCTLGSAAAGADYSGYAVCACNGANPSSVLAPLTNPLAQTADNFYVTMNYNISYTYTASSINTNYIAFNSQGEPGTFTDNNDNNECTSDSFTLYNPLSSTPISLSFGSSPSQLTFYIYPVTGLVSYKGTL